MARKRSEHDAHVRVYRKRAAALRRNRARRERIAAEQGRVCRAKPRLPAEVKAIPRHMRPTERQHRIQRARDARAKAGAKPRLHDAHVKARMHFLRIQEKQQSVLHNAHVSSWRKCCQAAAWRHDYRTDPEFNAREKVRARLRKLLVLDGEIAAHAAEAVKAGKFRATWQDVLGYSVDQLVAHLRGTVPQGWAWEDFLSGALHIDHRLPRSIFDLSKLEQVRECWRLSNLRLLPAADNIRKGARVEVEA